MPLNSSSNKKLLRKSFREKGVREVAEVIVDMLDSFYFQMLKDVCIQTPTTTSQTKVTGMNTFQPSRMIWS